MKSARGAGNCSFAGWTMNEWFSQSVGKVDTVAANDKTKWRERRSIAEGVVLNFECHLIRCCDLNLFRKIPMALSIIFVTVHEHTDTDTTEKFLPYTGPTLAHWHGDRPTDAADAPPTRPTNWEGVVSSTIVHP